jgi:predicted TIM-barrel fold metal-dependent hydrolase
MSAGPGGGPSLAAQHARQRIPGEVAALLVRGAKPAGTVIVDAHAHLGGWHNFHMPRSDAEGVLRTMDETGIDVASIAPMLAIGPDYQAGNELMAEAVRRYPDRFRGYVVVNPHYPSGMEPALRRYCEAPGVVGIKLHPGIHGYPISGPAYRPVWAFVDDRRLPVLIHTWGTSGHSAPGAVGGVAAEFPNATFLLGHSGGTWEGHLQAIEVAKERPNVYLETCISRSPFGAIEWMVREVGAERVVFGTDQPFIDPRPQLGRIAFAKIADAERRLILGGNAARLLGIG